MSFNTGQNQKGTVLYRSKTLENKGEKIVFYEKGRRILGKASRLMAGVYVVLDAIKDVSPDGLVHDIQASGRGLMSAAGDLLSVRTTPEVRTVLSATWGAVVRLREELSVGHLTGYLSEMNHRLLVGYLDSLLAEIEVEMKRLESARQSTSQAGQLVTLSQDFLEAPATRDVSSAPQDKQPLSADASTPSSAGAGEPSAPSSATAGRGSEGPRLSTTAQQSQIKESRQVRLVGLLARLGKVSMAEIGDEFPSVSDKTIQRDLGELIKAGKVIREGKRRWSTYRLA